jgi:hypothetical protein
LPLCAAPPVGVTTIVAGLLPVLVGLKATLKVQLAAAANGAMQVLVTRVYCVRFVPANVTLPAVNGNVSPPVLVFRTVTVVVALVVPTVTFLNAMEVGVRVKA